MIVMIVEKGYVYISLGVIGKRHTSRFRISKAEAFSLKYNLVLLHYPLPLENGLHYIPIA